MPKKSVDEKVEWPEIDHLTVYAKRQEHFKFTYIKPFTKKELNASLPEQHHAWVRRNAD